MALSTWRYSYIISEKKIVFFSSKIMFICAGAQWSIFIPRCRDYPTHKAVLPRMSEADHPSKLLDKIVEVYQDSPYMRMNQIGLFSLSHQDTLLLAGGATAGGAPGTNILDYYLYNLTTGDWSQPKQIHSNYVPREARTSRTNCVMDGMGRVSLVYFFIFP